MKEPPYQEPDIDGTGSNVNPPLEVHRDGALRVVRNDAVDYGTRRADGYYDYFYAFARYAVETGGLAFTARR